ncbi:MAG: SRPBCC family protein [Verrucomicrobia bacterium]|nr:SRPBCC family protein [Verrucomicrobiota bacterium]
MIKKILLLLVLSVIGFLCFIAARPADYTIIRSATIAAAPESIFTHVNDFQRWKAWSPWAKMDPNQKITQEGAPSGKGAIQRWEGNAEVGKGSQEITESVTNERIRMHLIFLEPFVGESDAEFTFQPAGTGTLVTWKLTGKDDFVGKIFSFLLNVEKMVGTQFDEGLANLAKIAAAPPQP